MIALRGIVRQNEEKKWTWKGIWTFGSLPKDEVAALQAKNPSVRPFVYSWQEARNASDVLVPSANMKRESQEKEMEESSNVAVDSSAVMADTPKVTQQTTEPKKEATKEVEMTEASEKKEADEDDKSKSCDAITMKVDESKEEAKEDGDNEKTTETKPTKEWKASAKDETAEKRAEEPKVGTMEKKEVTGKSEEYRKEPEKKDPVTFASTLPDEPPFTDACTQYPDKCPPGGAWNGYFETATGRKDKSTIQIPEIFSLFFNATPAKDARMLFPATDEDDHNESKEGANIISSGLLPPGYIHVRGSGSNQYGTWELIGSFNVDTGVLECQRMYVRMEEKKTPGRRGRPRKSEMKKKVSIGGGLETGPASAVGPRSTRKRQLSWRKRASLSEDDGADVSSRRSSTGSGKRGRPRKNVDTSSQAAPFVSPMGTISIPPTSTMKRSPPTPSPRGPVKSAMTGPKKRAKASPPATSSSAVKLPRAGDPNEARWRAAHFLYYQRYDDTTSDGEGAGGASNEGSDSFVVYEGEMSQGYCLREGRGVCLYNNGTLYEGEWKRNKEHGKGTLMTADRKHVIYEGDWERGRMQGIGVYYYFQDDPYTSRRKNDGGQCSRYEGEFRENTRHGNGKYFLPNGSNYDGEWREDVMSGRGTFKWPDGSVYIGSWKDGKRNGSGILQASDGFTYDGNWVENAMEGRGIATYPGGQRYEGLFTNGRREGRGSIHFANGAVYEGRFRDDCMEGQGTMKMTANAPIPRRSTGNEDEEDEKSADEDWMIPISFQSDIAHIHQKAGFTVEGE